MRAAPPTRLGGGVLAADAAGFATLPGAATPNPRSGKNHHAVASASREFVTGFDLGQCPNAARSSARARLSSTPSASRLRARREKAAEIVREMARAEGASPAGVDDRRRRFKPRRSLRRWPTASPGMRSTSISPSSRASSWRRSFRRCCRLPNSPVRRRPSCLRPSSWASRSARGCPAATRPTTAPAPGTAPAPSARSARRWPARG